MEENNSDEKLVQKKNVVKNGFCLCVDLQTITEMDLSSKNIDNIDEIKLPANLIQLNLSHNNLITVPAAVLKLENLKILNLSHNNIILFDDTPAFHHTLENLDLSSNKLKGPPYWIWLNLPENLKTLKLSCNPRITEFFENGYFEELLDFSTNIVELDLHNCKFGKHTQLLATFPKLKRLTLGSKEFSYYDSNSLIDAPCRNMEKCCDIQSLNLCNTHLYSVNSNIEIFKNIIEIDLSENFLHSLPNEFCNLINLEKCVLSFNKLLYLPDDMYKLTKLETLLLDSNELCMVPEDLYNLPKLKVLDLYDNHLNDVPSYSSLECFDLAQNYLDEPNDDEYIERKSKLRKLCKNRMDGRKSEMVKPDSEYSSRSDSEDDECYQVCLNNTQEIDKSAIDPPSSPEDWDSDNYWIPCSIIHKTPRPHSPWLYYVKQKMEEGNFCPMDAHTISISEKVKYQKLHYPEVIYESDGQFDDYSSDDS